MSSFLNSIKASLPSKPITSDDIIIGHNLSLNNLRFVLDDEGVITAPSVFATTKELGMSNFGGVTLVAGDELRARSISEMFDCDIFSPRSPNFTYDVSKEGVNSSVERLNALIEADVNLGVRAIDSHSVENLLKEGVQKLNMHGTSTAMMLAFCRDKGIDVDMEFETEIDSRWSLLYNHTTLPDVIRQAVENDGEFDWNTPSHRDAVKSSILDAQKSWQEDMGETKTPFDTYCVGARSRLSLGRAVIPIHKFITNPEPKLNVTALNNTLLHTVHNNELYSDWVMSNFEQCLGAKYIQVYDAESASYDEKLATAENVLMDYIARKGEGEGVFYGAGTLRAKLATPMNSEELLCKNAGRIVSTLEAEKFKDELTELMRALCDELYEYSQYDLDMDGMAQEVALCLTNYDELGSNSLLEAFNSEVLDDPAVTDLYSEFVQTARSAPTEYFEAKVYENVKLERFGLAIVPDNISDKQVADLKEAGVAKVVKYKAGDETDRLKSVNSYAPKVTKLNVSTPQKSRPKP